MKTLTIFGLMLITGSEEEKKKIEQVAAGTHHVHRNQQGGPRKAKVYGESPATTALKEVGKLRVADMDNTGDSNQFDEGKVMETLAGMEDKPTVLPQTEPRKIGQEAPHVSD